MLSVEEEAVIVAFRRYTLLPLDDCFYARQPTIPRLTRSSLHRHGIGRLLDIEGDRPAKKKFRSHPSGISITDNGIQFTTPGSRESAVPLIKEAIASGERFWAHAFEYTCATNHIEHRTSKPKPPWTNDGNVAKTRICRHGASSSSR